MNFYGSARGLLSRFEPQPEDELRCSSDSVDQLNSSVEYIRDFMQLDEDFSDDEYEEEIQFEANFAAPRFKPAEFSVRRENDQTLAFSLLFLIPFFGKVRPILSVDRCSVCLERYEDCDGKVLLECGHAFCADCLRSYLAMTVKETVEFKQTVSKLIPNKTAPKLVVETRFGVPCPSFKCCGVVCADTIHELADADTFSRFDRFCLRQTLDDLKKGGAIKLCEFCKNGYIQADCLCSDLDCRERTIAFRKTEERLRFRRWQRENSNSHHMLGVWMAKANVKCCPKCSKPIEKNLGCDHMYCSQCKTSFLWSQAPRFGTGDHWWRPLGTKGHAVNFPQPSVAI